MESLIDHTLSRGVEAYEKEITEACASMDKIVNATAIVTYGEDSSSHQMRFNQQLDLNPNDSQIFVVSINFVGIVAENGQRIYLNPAPHSPRSVRPQKIFFGKEDRDTNRRELQQATDSLNALKEKEYRFNLPSGNSESSSEDLTATSNLI